MSVRLSVCSVMLTRSRNTQPACSRSWTSQKHWQSSNEMDTRGSPVSSSWGFNRASKARSWLLRLSAFERRFFWLWAAVVAAEWIITRGIAMTSPPRPNTLFIWLTAGSSAASLDGPRPQSAKQVWFLQQRRKKFDIFTWLKSLNQSKARLRYKAVPTQINRKRMKANLALKLCSNLIFETWFQLSSVATASPNGVWT